VCQAAVWGRSQLPHLLRKDRCFWRHASYRRDTDHPRVLAVQV